MQPLLDIVLAGTARRAPTALDLPPALLPIDAALAARSAEDRVLLLAGAWSIYARAGSRPVAGPLPWPAAEPETLAPCSTKLAHLVALLLEGRRHALLAEACDRMAAAGQRLPADLLPLAFDVTDAGPFATLAPVLGRRGRWLAERLGDRRQAVLAACAGEGAPPRERLSAAFELGTIAVRSAALREWRLLDAAEARERVAAAWKSEKAEHRQELLEAFELGLGEADEPFLTAALRDRSKEVRGVASPLLARLSGSAYARRFQERADGILEWKKRLFGGDLLVAAPGELDAEWAADGVVEAPPSGIGPRAWWVRQVLRLVPPRRFSERFGLEPAALIAAAERAGAAEVLVAFAEAALLFGDGVWVEALLDHVEASCAKDPASPLSPFARRLVAQGEPAAVERALLRFLRRHDADPRVLDLLVAFERPWSVALGGAFLNVLAKSRRGESASPRWTAILDRAVMHLPPELLDRAAAIESELEGLDLAADAQRRVAAFVEIAIVRRTIFAETRP
jgi:hypothetical protein